MKRKTNLTNQVFGNLLVKKEAEPVIGKSGHRFYRWECECLKCGNIINVFEMNLKSGHSTGCKECSIRENMGKRHTHRMRRTRLYRVWSSMKTRCYNKSSTSYERYGGKGITVCDEWIGTDGFKNFADWALTHGYDQNASRGECTLDRINTYEGYYPDNCRFVNAYVQSNNREYNILLLDTDGELLTLKQLAKKYDISYQTIHSRWARGARDVNNLKKQYSNITGERVAHFK